MKRLIYCAIIAATALFTSCATTYTTVTVSGTPGTVIKNPEDNSVLGTIGSSKSLQVNLDRNKYYAYLLSKAPQSDKEIPFALEFEEETGRYNKAAAGEAVGIGLAAIGLCTEFGGLLYSIITSFDDMAGLAIVGIGAGVTIAGCSLGMVYDYDYRLCSDIKNCYIYLPSTTNDDLFTTGVPTFPLVYK